MKIHATNLLLFATIYVDLYVLGFLCVKKNRLIVCVFARLLLLNPFTRVLSCSVFRV